jgi:DNA-directed RNA polymerase subunit omega
MNFTYLEQARARVPNVPVLVNMVSKRIRQLISGQRPLVKPDSLHMEKIDIALKEIAQGKLTVEMLLSPEDLRHQNQERSEGPLGL